MDSSCVVGVYLEEPGLVVGVCEGVFEDDERLVVDGAELMVRGLLMCRDRHLEGRRRLFMLFLARGMIEQSERLSVLQLELVFVVVQLRLQRV